MNFNNLLEIAHVNKQNKPSTKGFSTAVAPAKKPPRSNVPSDAVKKFLEKREQMERQKEVEAKRQREKLLALRAQNTKSNKAAKLMSSRTKDNDFSRIRLTEDEVETKKKMEVQLQRQMLTDKVERMKARIKIQEEQEALPHKRKRKSKVTGQPIEADELSPEPIKEIIPAKRMKLDGNWTHVKPKGEPKKFRASKAPKAPLSFNELIRIAAEKQKNPNYQSEEEVEYSDDQEQDERLMTKKERIKHVEEQDHFNRSASNNKQTARQDRPNSSKLQSSSRPIERKNQSRDQNRPDNRNDRQCHSSRPSTNNSRPSMSNHRPNPASKPLLNGSKKSSNNSRAPPPGGQSNSQNSRPNSRDSRPQHPSTNNQARTSQPSSKSSREEISRTRPSLSLPESRGINGASRNGQQPNRNPNRLDSKPSIPSYNTTQSKPRQSLGQNPRSQSDNRPAQNSSLNSRNNGNQGQNLPNSSKPSISNASMKPQNDRQNERLPTYNTVTKKVIKQAPSRLRNVEVDIFVEDNSSSNGPINHPSSKPVPRSINPFGGVNSSAKNTIRPAGQISNSTNRPNERTNSNLSNRLNDRTNSNSTNRMNEKTNSTNRLNERTNNNSANRMNERPNTNSTKQINERINSNSTNRPGITNNPERQEVRGRGDERRLPPLKRRPSPSALSRRSGYPPSRHDPYPPSRALARNPYQKLPPITSSRPVRRIESDDEEDEDDEEMREFIDDDPIEDMEDYSRHIKEIFGYDKHRYLFEDDFDDEAMESSYAQQMKEELTSARLGFLEDMEDMKKEQEELKRKQLKKKGKLK